MSRKEKEYHFIYKTMNLINEKYYIGMHSTDNLNDGYIGSGKRLWHSIRKYGKENFKIVILEFFPDRSSLKEREKEIINEELLNDSLCMNLVCGGEGGYISPIGCKIGWLKMNNVLIEKYGANHNSFIMKKYHESLDAEEKKQHIKNIINGQIKKNINHNTFQGKTHSIETLEKMRKSKNQGEKNSQYGTYWITNGIDNKKIKKIDKIPDNWYLGRFKNVLVVQQE